MPKIPSLEKDVLEKLLGSDLLPVWNQLEITISALYTLNEEWHTANKGKSYELKYRKAGKTVVSLFPHYPHENKIGVMIIFGKNERQLFEAEENSFSQQTRNTYHEAKTYHDGKWVMFSVPDDEFMRDFPRLLAIKRKPDKN